MEETFDIETILKETENKYILKNHLIRMVGLYTKKSFETENGYKKMTDEWRERIKTEISNLREYISLLEEADQNINRW